MGIEVLFSINLVINFLFNLVLNIFLNTTILEISLLDLLRIDLPFKKFMFNILLFNLF